MTLPGVSIILGLYGPDGDAVTAGSVVFTPTARVLTGDGLQSIPPRPVTATLGSAAFPISVSLLPTDLPGAVPAGWAWRAASDVPGMDDFTFLAPSGPVSFTAASGTPGTFTWTPSSQLQAIPNGTGVQFSGSLPGGISAATTYFVTSTSGLTFKVAAAAGGSPIALTSAGSGMVTVASYFLAGLTPAGTAAALNPYLLVPAGSPPAGDVLVSSGTPGEAAWSALAASASAPGLTRQLVFNVRDFQAKVDGASDDVIPVNNAIAACSAGGGGIVDLTAGRLYLSRPAVPASGVHIRGAGMNATTIILGAGSTGANGDGIRLAAPAGSYASRVTVSDLTVDCSAQYPAYQLGAEMTPYSNGLTLQGIDDLTVENVRVIKPWGYGAFVGSPDGNAPYVKRPRIRNLHVQGGRGGWDALGGGGIVDGEVDGLYVYPADSDGTNHYGTASNWTNTLNTTVKGVHAWTTFVPGPVSAQATPAVPASGERLLSPFAFPVTIALSSGTVTACTVNGVSQGTAGPWVVPGFGTITLAYPAVPAWTWTAPTAPPVPASEASAANPFAFPAGVTVSGGTVSAVAVNGTPQGSTSGYFLVPLNGTITLTYTAPPAWSWGTTTVAGGIMTDFGATGIRYAGCRVNGFKYGVVITGRSDQPVPQQIRIDQCDFTVLGFEGIWTQPASGLGFSGVQVSGNSVDRWAMAGSAAAVHLAGTQGFRVTGNQVGTPGTASPSIRLGSDGSKGCDYGVITGNDLHANPAAQQITQGSPGSSVTVRGNPGYNPAGALTVAVPASGTATAAQIADAVFYVTAAGSGTTTVTISGGPVITVPAGTCVPVRVPGGQALTPAYASAPSWVVEGE